MRERTIKIFAIAASILALPLLYFATEEKVEQTIQGKVISTRAIRGGQILTVQTTLNIVTFDNKSITRDTTINTQGRLAPYKGQIEFIATKVE